MGGRNFWAGVAIVALIAGMWVLMAVLMSHGWESDHTNWPPGRGAP